MKKHLLTMAVGLFLIGGWAMAQTFTIQGKIDGVKSGKAELLLRESGKWAPKYSTGINEDGSFTLKGKVEVPDMYQLKIGDIRGGIGLFLDNSEITLVAKSNDLQNAEITGSATQDVLAGYNKLLKSQSEQMRPLYTAYSEANKAQKTAEVKKLDGQLEAMNPTQVGEKLAYIKSIIKSPVAAYLISSNLHNIENPADLESMIAGFDPNLAEYKYVKLLKESLVKMKLTAIGQVAPDFSQNDPDGKPIKLSDLRGKYVLVDFWASWCGPCRGENPNVVAAYNKYKNKNFTILGVSLDQDKDAWLKAIQDDKLTWSHVSDLKFWENAAAVQYGVRSIPANFLLDKNGKIIGKNLRGDALEEALAKYVK